MGQQQTNAAVGITHIWPYSKAFNDGAKAISDQREADVWDELRDLTFDEEVRGSIAFLTHEEDILCSNGEWTTNHAVTCTSLKDKLQEDSVVNNRVSFYEQREIEQTIHHPATEQFSFVSQTVAQLGTNEPGTRITVPAEPAGVETRKKRLPFHLGSKQAGEEVVKACKNHEICALVLWYPERNQYGSDHYLKHLSLVHSRCPDLPIYIFHLDFRQDRWGVEREHGASWRDDTKNYFELSQEKPEMLIQHLLPEKALTILAAPSYTGKTHIAIEMALALTTGTDFLNHFRGPAKPVEVMYHVPELHASLFRDFMHRLGADERLQGCRDNFLTRPLEHDLWLLDSPQMIESSRGRYVFLDTVGYFNDADDAASYAQAITFAKKINNLIREGCLGVCSLYHPPKYSKDKKTTGNVMTLENQILGSAGYGGVLRSCLGMRNLHEDSNKGLWVYVQGLKNPGLEGPFQIEGVPLKLLKKPGESLYLSELLKDNGGRREQALVMVAEGKTRDEICRALKLSPKTFAKWKQEDIEFDSND
jgi:hypothetical protein